MKCPTDKDNDLSELRVGGTIAHACRTCHGLLFRKDELEALKNNIEEHGWFDVSLWEEKALLSVSAREEQCPACLSKMGAIDWKGGEISALLCSSCGSMWLPKGEYEKAASYIKDAADSEVMEHFGAVVGREIEQLIDGKEDMTHGAHNLASLLRYFEYRFMAKHPVLTEVIRELPFTT
jgi:Zn-finger nucleic acid-binding protein